MATLAQAPVVPWLMSVGCLSFGTYLYAGYRYGVWPQPGLLEYVLRLSGALKADWMTTLPSPHWAMAHALAVVPGGFLEDSVLVLWVLGVGLLWVGVSGLARQLDVPWLAIVATGALVVPTSLDGLGVSQVVNNFMYPNGLAFAISVCGLWFAVSGQPALAGLSVGIATAVHPGLGLLAAAVLAPASFVIGPAKWRRAARYFGAFGVVAAFPLLRLALDESASGGLPGAREYDLIVVVRNPHHMLYGAFPLSEYRQTLLWVTVFAVAFTIMRSSRTMRRLAAVLIAVMAVATAGGVASAIGWPQRLVEAQTARITPFVVLLGIVSGVAALVLIARGWAAPTAFAVFLVAPRVANNFDIEISSAEALGVLLAIGITMVLRRGLSAHEHPPRLVSAAFLLATAVHLTTSDVRASTGRLSPDEAAWRDVAAEARRVSGPTDLFLTPPDRDGFRFYARRPIVGDFGNFPFGRGEAEWVSRMATVTGDASLLAPRRETDAKRVAEIAAAYDRTVETSRRPICRYHVQWVVARATAQKPPWLRQTYRNDDFALYSVRPGSC
jgi:Domain of unknown function (DUF6798)